MEPKIMIVDDALFMRKTIRKILEANGLENIVEMADGESALLAFELEKPELVILDITMPGMSGLEVLERMIQIAPQARIVMCSAMGQEMMIFKAMDLGARYFIVKPFKQEEFMKVVRDSLEGAK